MNNPAHQTANRASVRDYLIAAYKVDEETVITAMKKDTSIEALNSSIDSHAYWVGDKIATIEGWEDNPDFDIDEEDEEDED